MFFAGLCVGWDHCGGFPYLTQGNPSATTPTTTVVSPVCGSEASLVPQRITPALSFSRTATQSWTPPLRRSVMVRHTSSKSAATRRAVKVTGTSRLAGEQRFHRSLLDQRGWHREFQEPQSVQKVLFQRESYAKFPERILVRPRQTRTIWVFLTIDLHC